MAPGGIPPKWGDDVRAVRKRLAMPVVVLLLCHGTATGCAGTPWEDRYVDEQASAMMAESLTRLSKSPPQYPGIPLRSLTSFTWDKLFVFTELTRNEEIRNKTGFSFISKNGHMGEYRSLLIFVDGSDFAKAMLLRDGKTFLLGYESGKKYSSHARLLGKRDSKMLSLADQTDFEFFYDPSLEDEIEDKADELWRGRKKSVPLGDLGFAWDELHVIEPGSLEKETGLSCTGFEYQSALAAFMVFKHRGRIVRITEVSNALFPPEHRREVSGRKWSSKVRMTVRDEENRAITLQEP